MQTLEFNKNHFGKLFSDIFTDIRPYEYQHYNLNLHYNIEWNRYILGTGEIIGYSTFMLKKITDSMALINCGNGVAWQTQDLKQQYPFITPETQMVHLVIKYHFRDKEVQAPLLTDWWRTRREQFATNF